jgi:hypothetical protein
MRSRWQKQPAIINKRLEEAREGLMSLSPLLLGNNKRVRQRKVSQEENMKGRNNKKNITIKEKD